ncbi:MAG: cytochrome c maturation protein CcmE [Candidatus Methanoperedens sp.]|nr:cytochrome c maturation protein CcmE [Candidatus Methanoperedens sp.]
MNKKQKNMLGIGIVAVLILYLGAQSFSNALSFYYEVGEFVPKADSLSGKIVNVNGTILKGSTIWEPERARLTFKLTDKNATITVVSNEGMPGNYKEGIPAVVTGYYINGTFQATQVVTKCPSKYGGDLDHGDHNETYNET